MNTSPTPVLDKYLKALKTSEQKAPETIKQVRAVQKEQAKYKQFIKDQSTRRFNYIETKTSATV